MRLFETRHRAGYGVEDTRCPIHSPLSTFASFRAASRQCRHPSPSYTCRPHKGEPRRQHTHVSAIRCPLNVECSVGALKSRCTSPSATAAVESTAESVELPVRPLGDVPALGVVNARVGRAFTVLGILPWPMYNTVVHNPESRSLVPSLAILTPWGSSTPNFLRSRFDPRKPSPCPTRPARAANAPTDVVDHCPADAIFDEFSSQASCQVLVERDDRRTRRRKLTWLHLTVSNVLTKNQVLPHHREEFARLCG